MAHRRGPRFARAALPERIAAVDHVSGPRDITRSRRSEVNRERTNFVGVSRATHRDRAHERLDYLWILFGPCLVGLGHEKAWTDGVHGHAARRPVGGGCAGEMDDRGLGRFIVPTADSAIGDETADRGDVDDA